MSLNKGIEHHKEHRKPYRGAKAIDKTCRNHGGCDYCLHNRMHKNEVKNVAMDEREKEEGR